ncbi:hypothetical protein LPJ73_008618, partial [Coemansia sp. RSA 2703]
MSHYIRALSRNTTTTAVASRSLLARRIHSFTAQAAISRQICLQTRSTRHSGQILMQRVLAQRSLSTTSAAPQAEPHKSSNKDEEEGVTPDSAAEKDSTNHAVVSTFDLFSIGVGPSSSHTVGPMRAGKIFVQDLVDHKVLTKVSSIKVDLYGSLALTGIGHGTPNATLMGLEGELPETVPTETIITRVQAMHDTNTISLNGTHRVRFNPDKDMTLHYYESLPQHPNGMRFTVFDSNGDMLATN